MDDRPAEGDWTRRWYRRFADGEARGRSAIYEDWARGVAADERLLGLLGELPRPTRQPNLLFGASRLVGAPEAPFPEWRGWVLDRWSVVRTAILDHRTQTNEVLRCAALLPALALVPGPIALLEVGASAGLCLLLDRYSYRWTTDPGEVRLDPAAGPSAVELRCGATGRIPVPARMPDIVWRAGIDREPIPADDAEGIRWLETLVWPEEQERRDRLREALAIARREPPRLVRGDAVEGLPTLAAEAPAGATLVVLTSAALVYLDPDARAAFLSLVPELGARLVSLEGRGIVPAAAEALDGLRPRGERADFVLALDGTPLALVDPHGRSMDAGGIPWPS